MQKFDIIIPIPLHDVRLRERGYNQSKLLAEGISQRFHIKLSDKNLMRIRHTKNQAMLKQKERWTNIQGAFRIKYPGDFFNKTILIIDDLLTTGATASEAACMLKNSGAKRVDILTLAIAN